MKRCFISLLFISSLLAACNQDNDPGEHKTTIIPVYKPVVYNIFPHDEQAFTQGLIYDNGFLYEGTGLLNGQSSLRKVELDTGIVLQKINLDHEYFGEGIALVDDKIVQLTWQNKRGFVYDKNTFQLLDEFPYVTEGWGLTFDGENLIMSDGSDILYFLDPDTYKVIKQINVTADDEPVIRLNELEYINGKIYANIWQTDQIAIIQPDGTVTGFIDLSGILQASECANSVDVLNGIAYDPEKNRMYVTGKLWCKLFELEVVP